MSKIKYEKGNFAIVPNIAEAMILSDPGFKVYVALCKYADDQGGCFPSIDTIKELTMLSESGAKRGLREVRDKGFVEVTKRKRPNGSSASNHYQILIVVAFQVGGQDGTPLGATAEPPLTIPTEHPSKEGAKAQTDDVLRELYNAFRFYSLVVENNSHVPKMADKLRATHGVVVATAYLRRLQERDLRQERKTQEFVPQLRNWRDVVGKSAMIIDYYTRTKAAKPAVTAANQDEMVRKRMGGGDGAN